MSSSLAAWHTAAAALSAALQYFVGPCPRLSSRQTRLNTVGLGTTSERPGRQPRVQLTTHLPPASHPSLSPPSFAPAPIPSTDTKSKHEKIVSFSAPSRLDSPPIFGRLDAPHKPTTVDAKFLRANCIISHPPPPLAFYPRFIFSLPFHFFIP